ncbi:MAG TPA: 3-phenylpropionate/cinnamic acid dioxygenase subunit beta [Caulobacteraceae bacterium]|jgi:biphenyl 2,3-dioxygenase beta subunit
MTTLEQARPATETSNDAAMLERLALQYQVEQFLYAEAALLDARNYREWLGLLADDIRYWMPIRRTVTSSNLDMEFTRPGDMAYFDDDREVLEMRVRKLEAGSAWSEDPPSRSRHYVSNVRILDVARDEVTVEVCFHVLRTRLNSERSEWFGRREDVLRREGDGFRLARRHIFLDQTVIPASNMSTLF